MTESGEINQNIRRGRSRAVITKYKSVSEHSTCATSSGRAKAMLVKRFRVALLVAGSIGTFVGVTDAAFLPVDNDCGDRALAFSVDTV
jgi:hypothetical protein